jgi:transglutaminase-like putative cysteine protease
MATKYSYKKRGADGVQREIFENIKPSTEVTNFTNQVCAAHPELPKHHAILLWIQQNVHYIDDREKYAAQGWTDVFQFPMVTVNDGTGDCDDFAILATAMLRAAGYTAYLMLGKTAYGSHAWVEFYCTSGWYIIESETQYIVPESSRAMFGYFPNYQIDPSGNYKLDSYY